MQVADAKRHALDLSDCDATMPPTATPVSHTSDSDTGLAPQTSSENDADMGTGVDEKKSSDTNAIATHTENESEAVDKKRKREDTQSMEDTNTSTDTSKPPQEAKHLTELGLSIFKDSNKPSADFEQYLQWNNTKDDRYEQRFPKYRGRIQRRRRHDNLFVSQIRKLHSQNDEDVKAPENFFTNRCFFVPGHAATKVDFDLSKVRMMQSGFGHYEELDSLLRNKKYMCPITGCVKGYKRSHGLVCHYLHSVCEPEAEIADDLEQRWRAHDVKALGNVDGTFNPSKDAVVKDFPYLSQYRWPQDEEHGTWCIAVPQLEAFGAPSGLCRVHMELDHRWASSAEVEFLRHHCGKSIDIPADSNTTLVVKASEAHRLLQVLYPDLWKELERARHDAKHPPKKDAPDALWDGTVGAHNTPRKLPGVYPAADERVRVGSMHLVRETALRAAMQASAFNSALASERLDERSAFYDHHTQTMQYPSGKILRRPPQSHVLPRHVIALMPGQYESAYKRHKTLEEATRYVNSIPEGAPTKFGTRGGPAGAYGGSAAGDSVADEPDSHHKQRERVQAKIRARHEGQPDQKAMRLAPADAVCVECKRDKSSTGETESLVACSTCTNCSHPSCLQLTSEIVDMIRTYEWQCNNCKVCSVCHDPGDEEKMLFCDVCDRGYHTFCVGLSRPPKGRWVCNLCGMCASCGKTTPGGEHDPPGTAKWQHQYADDRTGAEQGEPKFLQTLCTECSALFNKGDFCPSCLVVYHGDDTDLPMVCCDTCDRWVHTECDDIDDETYEEMSEEAKFYSCLLCRGEQEERCDRFHRKYNVKRATGTSRKKR